MLRRSQLFVPANDERKIRKSTTLAADSIILDLEDAVPAQEKQNSRNLLVKLLGELDWGKREVCIRINKIGSRYSPEDISLVKKQSKVTSVVLPKNEKISGDVLKIGKTLIPLIETPVGLLRIEAIARSEGVEAISLGPADLANSIGGKTEAYSKNLYVKTKIAVTSAAYGIDAIDCVFFDLQNFEEFRKEATQSRDLGYVGKQVIHPSQITIANNVYSPSAEEIESAKKLIEAYESAGKDRVGALRMDEKLVDAVHYRMAKATVERASNFSEP